MKISKNLLQAILVGATLGTAVSSCATARETSEVVNKQDIEQGDVKADTNDLNRVEFYCPGCGRG